ncbi:glutathione S-transferase [Byssothecium circinans]|uniref:Glutathione S-transferase n=1 Tax=Byssothecium circinans TaxID=147558 RepID=A0A6A5U172_9PLEO|nr:glutathione S-transferase [Byssothecium circinans]
MASQKSNITLYTTQTPNGIKISITLEELGLPYKEPWFLAINPNGRIPALTDTFTDGQTINLFESGSIMQYLVKRYDTEHNISYPEGSREYYEFFQNAGVRPMQGQATHFNRYAPERIEYRVNRYVNETRRLYGVLDNHLSTKKNPYLVGEKCTIADIAHWGWVAAAAWAGVDIEEFPALKAWEERMAARPALEKGRHVPDPHTIKEFLKNKAEADKHAAAGREWVQAGMEEDAAKAGQK